MGTQVGDEDEKVPVGTQVGMRMRRFRGTQVGDEDEKVPVGTQVGMRMRRFQWGHKWG